MSKEVDLGPPEAFPVGQCTVVEIDGREFGVVRLPSGDLRAFRNACPHKAAPICKGIVGGTWLPSAPDELVFGMDGEVIVCPWHGYEFDLNTGLELFQSDPLKLRLFPVDVKDGKVVVTV